MPLLRDFLSLVRAARQHVVIHDRHVLGRFDDDLQRLRGYHCVTCGNFWMISDYDITASILKDQNILECAEMPDGLNILLEMLNASPDDLYLHPEVSPLFSERAPSADPQSRYDRKAPL